MFAVIYTITVPIKVQAAPGYNPAWDESNSLPGFNPVIEYTTEYNEQIQSEETNVEIFENDVEINEEIIYNTNNNSENKTFISDEYVRYCEEIGDKYGISSALIESIIEHESAGLPNVGNGQCVGLMAVSIYWNRERCERLGVTNLYNPYSNILVGTDLLAELFDTYNGDLYEVLNYYGGWEWSDKGIRYMNDVVARMHELQ